MYRGAAHLDSVAVAPIDTHPHVNVAIAPIATRRLLEIARYSNRESAIDAILARKAREGLFHRIHSLIARGASVDHDRVGVRAHTRAQVGKREGILCWSLFVRCGCTARKLNGETQSQLRFMTRAYRRARNEARSSM